MTVEQFSSGYYIGSFDVEQYNGETAALPRDTFEDIEYQVYAGLDMPVFFKIGSHHVPVRGEAGIPRDTLALPPELVNATDLSVPDRHSVLVARKNTAQKLLDWNQLLVWWENRQ